MPARPKRPTAAEDLYRLQLISGVDLSPDGAAVVTSVSRVDAKTQKKRANLWLVPVGRGQGSSPGLRGGAPRQFTWGDQCDTQARWSPDGRQIAFLSDRQGEGQAQIHVIPVDGGEARPVTVLQGSFTSLAWSPDSRRLVFGFRRKDAEVVAREKDEQKKKLGPLSHHITRAHYKLEGAGVLPRERWHLWTVEVRTGRARPLTDGDVWDESEPVWTPDGQHVLYTSNRSDDPDLNPDQVGLYVIPARGGRSREIPTWPGRKGLPAISPDGQWVSFVGRRGVGNWWKNQQVWVVPFKGGTAPRSATGKHDFSVSHFTLNDVGAGAMTPPTWSADGARLYFQVSWHGNTELRAVTACDGTMETVIAETGCVGDFSFSRDGKQLAFFRGTPADPGQVWTRDMEAGASRCLTRFNRSWLDRVDLGQVEEVWFKGGDGNRLQGWIARPPRFSPRRRYPAIVYVHGGPLAQYGNLFMHEFYFLAAQGYVVGYANPRGGLGYGEAHAGAIWNNWGTVDFDDVMAWSEYLARRRYVDGKRLGIAGGSYGGYMTNWVIGHTDRFAAACTQRSVSNAVDFYGSTDFSIMWEEVFGGAPPWEDLENYWRQSPMAHIGKATTPTQVIHSEQDHRCPISQGEQVYAALKRLGVDTEMVRFPDESHELSRGGRTDRRVERLNHILRWFDTYLKTTKRGR